MAIKIIDCIFEDAGLSGIRAENADLDIKGTLIQRTGASGVDLLNSRARLDQVHIRQTGGHSIRDVVTSEHLLDQFPVLKDARPEYIDDVISVVQSAPDDKKAAALQASSLGRWLGNWARNQPFVDWANLAVAIAGLVK